MAALLPIFCLWLSGLGLTSAAHAHPDAGPLGGVQTCNGYLDGRGADALHDASTKLQTLIDQLHRTHTAGKALFESVDDYVRTTPEIGYAVLELALRRLPFLRETPFNIVLSGGLATAWKSILEEHAAKVGLKIKLIVVGGGLSENQFREVPVPEQATIRERDKAFIASAPTIFIDDSYSSGQTAAKVAAAVEAAKGTYLGTFVAFARTMGNPVALIRQPTPYAIHYPVPQPPHPSNWQWIKKPALVLLDLEWEAFQTEEAFHLLKVLHALGTQVAIPSMELFALEYANPVSAKLIEDAGTPTEMQHKFDRMWPNPFQQVRVRRSVHEVIRIGRRKSDVVVIGMWELRNVGRGNPIGPRFRMEQYTSTRVDPEFLTRNYYLDRLVEQGYLTPIFTSTN